MSRFLRLALLGAALAASAAGPALADPTPPPTAPPALPASVPANGLNNPDVQSGLNAVGGLTQSTNGAAAFGKVVYFKRFDLELETAPSVYRKVRLHQGTVINPRGATIQNGMTLQANGSPQPDGTLGADTITVR